jgi:uncharacterized protein YbaA (DUF1428 family)
VPASATSFPRSVKLKRGETVVFSWIIYKSRAHRDKVMAKVMKDRARQDDEQERHAVRRKRMIFGGFKMIVEA